MEILGQPHALKYLALGLANARLSPSLIFTGPDGVGKRSCAMELAQCFVCENPPAAAALPRCGDCTPCRRVSEWNHSDILLVDKTYQATLLREKPEVQTAMKIDAVRAADKFLNFKPMEARRRMVVIDDAHELTSEAANALLKVLEEPPHNAQIVLVALNEKALPSTVLSRCAIVRFRPVPTKVIAEWLEKNHGVDFEIAWTIADRAGGSFSKALAAKDDDGERMDISEYKADDFFEQLAGHQWRKEGRKNAERAITFLIESARRKLEQGDLGQKSRITSMLLARRRLDRHVPPRLVLETLFTQLEKTI
jgi:DNA polymerase-3 subunit delta'